MPCLRIVGLLRNPLSAFLAVLILPRLLLRMTGLWPTQGLPVVNLEMAILMAVAGMHRASSVTGLAILNLGVELGLLVLSFYDYSPLTFIQAPEGVFTLVPTASRAVVGLGMVFLAGSLMLAVSTRWAMPIISRTSRAHLLVTITGLVLCDVVNGTATGVLKMRERQVLRVNVVGSSAWSLIASMMRHGEMSVPAEMDRALTQVTAIAEPGRQTRLLLVVVEGLGALRNDGVRRMLTRELEDAAAARGQTLQVGTVAYRSSTLQGEVRELCGRSATLADMLTGGFDDCLPTRFTAAGGSALALQGFFSSVYRRQEWYPAVGFRQKLFLEQLNDKPHLSRCGGLHHGLCDHELVPLAAAWLRDARPPALLFFLTLNSHVPDVMPPGVDGRADCAPAGLTGGGPVCDLITIWRLLLSALVTHVVYPMADVDLLMVGDHAPPLYSRAERAEFQDGRVQWLYLPAMRGAVSGTSVLPRQGEPPAPVRSEVGESGAPVLGTQN